MTTPARTPELSIHYQGTAIYVIGTGDVQAAARAVGLSPETHTWGSTDYGHVVRRQGLWRYHTGLPHLPKDAKPCVSFHGPIKEQP